MLDNKLDLIIRSAQASDRKAIFQLQQESIQTLTCHDYSLTQIKAMLDYKYLYYYEGKDFGDVAFIAQINHKIVGFAALQNSIITALYVHPEYTRQGIGTLLINQLETITLLRDIKVLNVAASLTGKPFYEACGYQDAAKSFTTCNDIQIPIVFMRKRLAPPSDLEKFIDDCISGVKRVFESLNAKN